MMPQQAELRAKVGTPDYMAPELLLGERHGRGVDLWALGCLAFELLTGYTPFTGGTVEEVFEHILDHTDAEAIRWPEEAGHLSAEAVELVVELLHPLPDRRLGADGLATLRDHPFFGANGCTAAPPSGSAGREGQALIDDLSEASGFDGSSAVPAAAARDGGAEAQSVPAVWIAAAVCTDIAVGATERRQAGEAEGQPATPSIQRRAGKKRISQVKALARRESYNKTPSHNTGHGTGAHWH
ncbi:hypothetical protein EMIHUDRAFT_252585 [Emiliania huxleyi CCMP1516]|uniref:non-specific serine/threonine protein kinase n=2 Tax=Emiliania huxleyi TaxID=2903 RepID=A0A0D3KIW8_EMIH1|nr:hypothetical protein EMIHUDRAFT_252585 [Emiliania huxleyi CCMP1516]EOD35703.1 hypothetical protein EMIHUDRAFT_252585 [Emiliania huxleyi CCMP1516]|eukprot:XP_005788132.1 hypothetical protein EMIHUDRAFT_252585 [Emiliania huxleyi CCMP1516]